MLAKGPCSIIIAVSRDLKFREGRRATVVHTVHTKYESDVGPPSPGKGLVFFLDMRSVAATRSVHMLSSQLSCLLLP